MKHILTITVTLIGALLCYALGLTLGVALFFIAGGALELYFWVLLIRSFRRNESH